MRCSALATRANGSRGVPGAAWDRETSPCTTCWVSRSRSRRTTHSSSSPCGRRGVRAPTRRLTTSTTSGPVEPSRTSIRFQAPASSEALQASTRCPGGVGGRRRPLDAAGAVSRSRLKVWPGTARLERSPRRSSRRRNQYGRPISSSPALHPCGSCVPLVCHRSNAHGCRARYPRWAWGTPALSRRALSVVHALGQDSRMATRVGPAPDTEPKETAT
jgi:hypothetical protein